MTGNTRKYVTQYTNIYQQLSKGIPYFDSRPAPYENQIGEYHGVRVGLERVTTHY